MDINIKSEKEEELKKALGQKHDPESERMVRFLAMPDLSREEGSSIRELIERLLKIKIFEGFDIIKIPEIVPAHESFDLFDFPADQISTRGDIMMSTVASVPNCRTCVK